DTVSLQTLRNLFFKIDSIANGSSGSSSGSSGSESGSDSSASSAPAPTVDVLTYEAVSFDGGLHGSHLVAKSGPGATSLTINQIAVLDASTTKIYAIVVSCTTKCYEKNRTKIEQVMSSWTVRDS